MSHIFASFGEKESRCGISSFLFAQRRKDAADLYSFSHKETKMSHIFASFGEKERRYVRSSCLSATKDFLFGQRNKDTAHLCSFPPQGIRMWPIFVPFGEKESRSARCFRFCAERNQDAGHPDSLWRKEAKMRSILASFLHKESR